MELQERYRVLLGSAREKEERYNEERYNATEKEEKYRERCRERERVLLDNA